MQIYIESILKSGDSAENWGFHTLSRLTGTAKTILPVLFMILLLYALPREAQQQTESREQGQIFDRWDPTDEGMKTGPAIGETIPEFEAEDQNGKLISFQNIIGPKGAVILFHRSADW